MDENTIASTVFFWSLRLQLGRHERWIEHQFQVAWLVGDVLGDFGQEIEGAEDLEIAARSASQVGTGSPWEAAASVLFGAVQHRAVVGQADHADQAKHRSRNN